MKTRAIRLFSLSLLAALVTGAVFAGGAAAAAWKFSGTELSGTELTVGFGLESSLTLSEVPVQCEHLIYKMNIWNSGGKGKGEVTELPHFSCTSTGECTVEALEAEKLPWPAHLATVGKANYVVIEGIEISILYGGELCALEGVQVPVTGSAGGLFDNSNEAAVFDEASFVATGTALTALGSPVRLEGEFPTEAFQWHREEPISVS
jgi:hypothetical protein